MSVNLILLVVVLLLVFGGVGYVGPRYHWGTPHYGGVLLLVIVVLLILALTGRL